MKIRIVTPNADHAQSWASALGRADEVATAVQPVRLLTALTNGIKPDVVVVETLDPRDLDTLESLAGNHPDIDCVLVSNDLTPEALLRMMRAGVREVLPAPASADALAAAVQRIGRKRAATTGAGADAQGQILSFVSCKGGSGATFVAANVAHVLAAGGQRKVALIDANLQFGDAMLFVSNEHPARNLADVAADIGRLDRDFLRSAMTQASPGLFVLPAPDDPSQATGVQPEHLKAILRVARETFDFVVVDVGRGLSATTLPALDMADRIYAVLQLTLPFIRDGKRLRDAFRSLEYPASKVRWLVNRYEKDNQITLDDLKRTLKIEGVTVLPNQYQVVAASVNQGVPVESLAAGSAIARGLRDLAAEVAPTTDDKRRGGWLSGLMRSGSRTAARE
jgi:pilus assembly protein CpaE